MSNKKSIVFAVWYACVAVSPILAQREVERPVGGIVDFLKPVEPDPLIQHSKEVYVKNGCAYCHGVDLKVRNGEAADLMHSALVGADVNANILGPLLRNGIAQTAKLSPMPQYKDLSDKNLEDLARWIHYSRQQGRFNDLRASEGVAGDAAAGKIAFEKSCSSCHSSMQMTTLQKRYTPAELRIQMLRPTTLNGVKSFEVKALHDEKRITAKQRHGSLLENATPVSTANLSAYLATQK